MKLLAADVHRRGFFSFVGALLGGLGLSGGRVRAIEPLAPTVPDVTSEPPLVRSEEEQRKINSILAAWVDRGPWQHYDTMIIAPPQSPLTLKRAYPKHVSRSRRKELREMSKGVFR